jgi:hypothetical protein
VLEFFFHINLCLSSSIFSYIHDNKPIILDEQYDYEVVRKLNDPFTNTTIIIGKMLQFQGMYWSDDIVTKSLQKQGLQTHAKMKKHACCFLWTKKCGNATWIDLNYIILSDE